MSEHLADEEPNFTAPKTGFNETTGPANPTEEVLNDQTGQARLLEILANPGPEMQTVRISTKAEEKDSPNGGNMPFLRLLGPKLVKAKVMDLFCGNNPFKEYFAREGNTGQAVGVDLQNPAADIQADVAKITEIIPPDGQFDLVTSFGSHPGFESYSADSQYLKPDGLYIYGASDEIYDEDIQPDLDKFATTPQETSAEMQEAMRHFEPIVAVRVDGIRISEDDPAEEPADYTINKVYIIFRKRQSAAVDESANSESV